MLATSVFPFPILLPGGAVEVRFQNSFVVVVFAALTCCVGCSRLKSQVVRTDAHHRPSGRHEGGTARAAESERDEIDEPDILLVNSEELPAPDSREASEISSNRRTFARGEQGTTMRLSDFESLAMQYNPTLSQAAAGVDQGRGEYRQAGLYPNPQVGYLNTTANQSDPKRSNGVFLSQEIVTAKKLQLAQESSSQEIKRLQWDQEAQRMRVLNDIRIRYYEVVGAQRILDETTELVKLAEETVASAEKLFTGKGISKPDVNQARMQLETAKIAQAEAVHRHDAAWKQLRVMIGLSELAPCVVLDESEHDSAVLDEEVCWQRLLNESPQLRSSESELDRGRVDLRAAHAQAIPNVTLQTVTDYDQVSNSTTVSTLVALPLPLHNRNQGNIDRAVADIRADEAEICRVQLVLRDQLADSFKRYNTSRVQAERLKAAVLPNAEESLNLSKASFVAGEISFRDVLFAQQAYSEARLAYLEAVTEQQKVAAEIEGLQLTGGLNPAAIGSAIQNQGGGASSRQRVLLNEVKDKATRQLLPAAQISQ